MEKGKVICEIIVILLVLNKCIGNWETPEQTCINGTYSYDDCESKFYDRFAVGLLILPDAGASPENAQRVSFSYCAYRHEQCVKECKKNNLF